MPKAGYVVLIGRPNAGKSTLLNQVVAEKVAIVSDKPQTTRHRIVGILNGEPGQIVFFDTPGTHRPLHQMNKRMMQHTEDALREADCICLLHDATESLGGGDAYLFERLRNTKAPVVVALNKIDKVHKPKLLPRMAKLSEAVGCEEIVPVSALRGTGCDALVEVLFKHLPEGSPFYDPDLYTTHPESFLVVELVREKLLAHTRDELPFTTATLLERWEDVPDRDLTLIHIAILVERDSQKGILVGKGGNRIKTIGVEARKDIEHLLGRRVYLDLHVRVEARWRDSQHILSELDRS